MARKAKKKSWFRRRVEFAAASLILIVLLIAGNWVYQVWQKPTELIGLFDEHFHKNPTDTWSNYSEIFRDKATEVMTPTLLAALAQAESNGNPVVRTYWKWRWTTDPGRMYGPASGAAGMFQITQATFAEAKEFCVRDGQPRKNQEYEMPCGETYYSRLLPSHAIEMTAARLHWQAEKILARFRSRRVSLVDKQNLAIVIHLCGVAKGEQMVRAGMRLSRLGRCGDHSPVVYVRQVRRLERLFRKISRTELADAPLVARRE